MTRKAVAAAAHRQQQRVRVRECDRVRDVVTDSELVERFLTHVRAGQGATARERMLIEDAVADARIAELTA